MAIVLVTGAAGFIGRGLCPALAARGHRVLAGLRHASPDSAPAGAEPRMVGEIAADKDWRGAFEGAEIIIHLAQRAHRRADPNVLLQEPAAAAALARSAAAQNVRRLVYLSSIKAMGDTTPPGRPFRADDPPRPADPYGRGKLATEQALQEAAASTGLELVVVRPPLVYGPGVRANFRALLRLAASGLPLPFAGVDNRRSLIARDNLVDLLAVASVHPAAAGQVLLASDGEDFSTPLLIATLAAGLGRRARLFPVPDTVFAMLRGMPRIGPLVASLTNSLQADAGATAARLGWTPPVAAAAALAEAARAFAGEP